MDNFKVLLCAMALFTVFSSMCMDIFDAIREGDQTRIRELLDECPPAEIRSYVNRKDGLGVTALHYAAMDGQTGLITILLAAGADVDIQGNDSLTPIHYAAQRNNIQAVQLLIEAGANVNLKSNAGHNPLHLTRNEKVIQALIAAGADLNATNNAGRTPPQCTEEFNATATFINIADTAPLFRFYQDQITQARAQARQQIKEKAFAIAQALHTRLGAESPAALMPQALSYELFKYFILPAPIQEAEYRARHMPYN
jgi:hypothetical protein